MFFQRKLCRIITVGSKAKKKRPETEEGVKKGKSVSPKNSDSWKGKCPVWRFSKFDSSHPKWGSSQVNYEELEEKLISFEKMTWQEIDSASGGKSSGTNNHFLPIEEIESEAQVRLNELHFEEFSDNLYSLRINGKHRLIGILSDGIFEFLWNDPDHEVCRSRKKHT